MIEAQRRAYLEAMDISVWLGKPAETDRNRIIIGPGSGSTLLLCRDPGESATPLASDICRYLGETRSGPGRTRKGAVSTRHWKVP